MKDKNIHFIIGSRGYGKAYHELIEKIKELEKEIEHLNKQNRKLFQSYATYKNATDMYKKEYEKLLEENEELKKKIEINEEDKKLKKLMWVTTDMFKQEIVDKINEIIDHINKGEDK